jgi:hypothetical protein
MDDQTLKSEAKKMLGSVSVDTIRETVAKSRWTCDSHWMMAMVMNAGWETANRMNLQVGKATGKVEMIRLMRDLNTGKPKNEHEMMMLMAAAMETFITKDYFDYEFKILGPGRMVGIIRKCYAYTKVKSIGVDKNYQCGCFGLRAGWYEAMGLEVKEDLVKCLKDGADQCEIMVESVRHMEEKPQRAQAEV